MEYSCRFCGRVCKNTNSLRNHERLCKFNPEKQFTWFELNTTPESRSNYVHHNQFSKAIELGKHCVVSKETRDKISKANKCRSKVICKRIGRKASFTIQQKVKNGTWHTSLAKKMHHNYKGIDLHGKWELAYAKYLDKNNIAWVRPKDRFPYQFNEKQRFYTPDFYLPVEDTYIEIKGYKTVKDEQKWKQFPKNLKILTKKELKTLDII